jgi:hypothetical protein
MNPNVCGNEWLWSACCPMLVSCLAHSSNLKTEVICSSETSVEFHMTKRRCILKQSSIRTALFSCTLFNHALSN